MMKPINCEHYIERFSECRLCLESPADAKWKECYKFREYHYKHKEEVEKVCPICGKHFFTNMKRKGTCSPKCSLKLAKKTFNERHKNETPSK